MSDSNEIPNIESLDTKHTSAHTHDIELIGSILDGDEMRMTHLQRKERIAYDESICMCSVICMCVRACVCVCVSVRGDDCFLLLVSNFFSIHRSFLSSLYSMNKFHSFHFNRL